jgi:tellurite resistance protein TerA
MPIDYTKRPAGPPAAAPAGPPPGGQPGPTGKVTLTKSAPSVSLTKKAAAGGVLKVNLNWTARPPGDQGGGFFRRREPDVDLDLGCLFEFADGTKGVVQALGNAFRAALPGAPSPAIWLDGDDRSGAVSGGENLFVDLQYAAQIRRVLVFAYIYQGVPNWAAAQALVTLTPPDGPQIEVALDEPRNGAMTCAVAQLLPSAGDLSVHREVRYVDGAQPQLDAAYGWGIRWSAGRK